MKRLTLGALALLLCSQLAGAAPLTITRPWTAIRARPATDAPVLQLAFGNDTLPLVRTQADWLAVRLPDGRLGWLSAADAELATDAAAAATVTQPPAGDDTAPIAAAADDATSDDSAPRPELPEWAAPTYRVGLTAASAGVP